MADETTEATETPAEWWPELGPKWEATTAPLPGTLTIDIHSHVMVPASAELAMPHFEPEMDPRAMQSNEETTRYNREHRATQVDRFTLPETRGSTI